jgi:hypothetical protein
VSNAIGNLKINIMSVSHEYHGFQGCHGTNRSFGHRTPSSHTLGILSAKEIQDKVQQEQAVCCEVPAGGAVIMRPHILHSSGKSASLIPRRILHFEYSSYKLPKGISWF